jgi:crotonobetainyl-CoA:carnitine CoA-transferase CaiB-like acyl-CoA transferase
MGILDGIRILDVAHPYGQYCGKLLADLGADVIKIEPPGGDPGRKLRPFKGDDPSTESSLFFAYYDSGKRSVVLDPASAEGRAAFDGLVRDAHGIIETPAHGNAGGLKLDFDRLRQLNPDILLASITGFVDAGPYRDYRSTNAVIFALSGVMKGVGPPEGPPEAAPGQVAFDLAAVDAATALVCGLLTGKAEHIRIAAHEVLSSEINPRPQNQFDDKRHPGAANPQLAPSGTYKCEDGGVVMFVNLPGHWAGLKELLGNPAHIAGPEWEDRSYRHQHADEISQIITASFASRRMAEIVEQGQRLHVPCGPVNTIATFAADPHAAERKYFVDAESPALGHFKMPGAPYKLSDAPWEGGKAAPLLGQDTDVILSEAKNPSSSDVAESAPPEGILRSTLRMTAGAKSRRPLTAGGSGDPARPLAGVRVVAFTTAFAGPTVGRYLGDLGAEVIKVESRRRWDNTRHASSAGVGGWMEPNNVPTAPGFGYFNRNQLGVSIDLSQNKGREVMLRLLGLTDVVIENFSRQVLSKWGYTYAGLKEVKPDIILLDMQGFGQTGPLRDYISFGSIIHSYSGLSTLWGTGGHGFFVDYVAAEHAAFAVASAVYHRRRTGRGMHIDMAQLETAGAVLGLQYLDYFVNGVVQRHRDGRLQNDAPSGCYPCHGDDAWCVIDVTSDDEWRRLREAIGDPSWAADARFESTSGRLAARAELDQHLADWTRPLRDQEVQSRLQAAGVPAAAVLSARQVFEDPQLLETGFYWNIDHAALGPWPYPRLTVHIDDAAEPKPRPAPLLGEHNDYVFGELLSMPAAEIRQLTEEGVLA